MTSARDLVRQYVKQAHPLERRGNGGPEQLPAGAAIIELDDGGRARVAVEAYRALPSGTSRARVYGECIMLGLLATTLLRKNLPLTELDLEAMAIACANAIYPAWGPCDYDAALIKALSRAERITPKTKAALRALAKRRGDNYAIDRRIGRACDEIASR